MDIYKSIGLNLDSNYINENFDFLSAAALNSGIFQQDAQHYGGHIKDIHDFLNSGETRERGIALLLDVVRQCPKKILYEQGSRWFKLCSQALTGVKGGRGKTKVCRILIEILRNVSCSPDLQRTITTHPPGTLILLLAAAESSWNCTALECLCEYLKIAPVPCLPFKGNLEKCIFKYLDAPLGECGFEGMSVRWAGQVYAILPLPGKSGAGVQGHAESRARHFSSLLALAHSLMDQLFEGIIENESYDHTREHGLKLNSAQIKNDPVGELLHVLTRLINTLTFTAVFLTTHTIPILTVAPHEILSVVFRILQLELSVVQKYQSQEHKLVAFFLPLAQQHALLLLQDILSSIGEAVDLYWGPILNLLMLVVKCYSAENGGQRTRTIAYTVLETLMKVSKGRHPPSPSLLVHVTEDFLPKLHHITLQKSAGLGSGLKSLTLKNKKKKGYKVVTSDSQSQLDVVVSQDELCNTACAALKLVQAALSHSAHSLHYKAHQQLQSALLNVGSCVIGLAPSRQSSLYVPGYTRTALVEALSTLTSSPNPRWPPPYTLATDLFSAGLADEDAQVTNACQLALDSVRIIAANPQSSIFNQICQHPDHNSEQGRKEDDMSEENGFHETERVSCVKNKQFNESDSGEEYYQDVDEERDEDEEENIGKEDQEKDGDNQGTEEEKMKENTEEQGEDELEKKKKFGTESFISEIRQQDDESEIDMGESEDDACKETSQKRNDDRITHSSSLVTKRPAEQAATAECRKKKNKKSEQEDMGPSVDEMMATFVDSDLDDN